MEVPFKFCNYSNYMQLIKAVLCHVAHFVERTFLLCVVVITASYVARYSQFFSIHVVPMLRASLSSVGLASA